MLRNPVIQKPFSPKKKYTSIGVYRARRLCQHATAIHVDTFVGLQKLACMHSQSTNPLVHLSNVIYAAADLHQTFLQSNQVPGIRAHRVLICVYHIVEISADVLVRTSVIFSWWLHEEKETRLHKHNPIPHVTTMLHRSKNKTVQTV